MMELIKFWVQKTKEHLKETEREKEIKEWYRIVFGCNPEHIRWTDKSTVKAFSSISQTDFYILGSRVWEAKFTLEETSEKGSEYSEWEFFEEENDQVVYYTWKKRVWKYKAEIILKVLR